jgi:CBS domain-containing protein
MKVADLMTREVLAVPADVRVSRADLEMRLAEIRHLPVVDREGKLVGVISQRDLRAVPAFDPRGPLNARDVMHGPVSARPDDDAASAVALLIEKKIGCLPVVDAQSRVIGIVTETDFLNVAYQALSGLPLHGRTRRT